MAFEVGQIVGDYQILDILGKGGMGRVYRVRNVISNRIEAMKVLLSDFAAEPELGERFSSEIRTLARLDHPNIAKLHTAFRHGNQLVMMMEFVEGQTLSERARQGPMPLDDVITYMNQTLAALGYAHENGVVHRDIKPSNIMLTSHGVVKLMDFGIAKSSTESMQTRVGTTMGSMQYMSPEQVRGTGVDARSDLYSMGVVLYELTCGRRPFESESAYSILEAQLNKTPQAPIQLNPNLPRPLNDIIMTALEKEPMRRFQSAEAFRKALDSIKEPPPPLREAYPATTPAAVPVAPASSVNNRTIWMALGALVCVLALIAAAIAIPHFSKGKAASSTDVGTSTRQTAINTPAQKPDAASASQPPLQTATQPSVQTVNPPITNRPLPNQSVNGFTQPVRKGLERRLEKERVQGMQNASLQTTPNQSPQQAQNTSSPPQTQPQAPAVSKKDLEDVQETLMQMHVRADTAKNSVNRLRRSQAADGLEISPEISGAAGRLESYLQAADRAAQNNDVAGARKYMESAERQLGVLEAKFGR